MKTFIKSSPQKYDSYQFEQSNYSCVESEPAVRPEEPKNFADLESSEKVDAIGAKDDANHKSGKEIPSASTSTRCHAGSGFYQSHLSNAD